MKRRDDPSQLTFAVFTPPVIERRGDTFVITPGKPTLEVTTEQLADRFGVDRSAIYRWRNEGLIPETFVIRKGIRKLAFNADIISHLEKTFKTLHE